MVDDDGFAEFFRDLEPRLRGAFTAQYGFDAGSEAASEALAYAWQHWDRVRAMANPAGYLYRVGQSRTRALRRRSLGFPPVSAPTLPDVEPGLPSALQSLPMQQRIAVVLVYAYGLSIGEVAQLTGTRRSTVQKHVERGMRKLRAHLKVGHDE